MVWVYILVILLFRVAQAFFSKRTSNEISSTTTLVGYNAYQNAVSAILGLVLILVGGTGFRANLLTIAIASFSGLTIFASGFCGVYAMKSGTVSLNSMFATAGMLIPIFVGVIFWGDSVAPMQLVGLALFFLSAYLLISASKTIYTNFSFKTLLLLIGTMLANGCTMLAQQMFTHYVPDGDVSVFSFLSFGIIAVLSGIFFKLLPPAKKPGSKDSFRSLLICGGVLALCVFVINQLATISTALISPVILFSFIMGGGTIISTLVAAIVYKEKISLKIALGIIIGVVSLIMIKLFA